MITVKVSGTLENLIVNSISIETAVEERSTATFKLADLAGDKNFVKGQPVEITVSALLSDVDYRDGVYLPVVFGETGEYFLQAPFVIGGNRRKAVVFSGIVYSAEKKKVGATAFIHSIECIDYHYAADKRLAAKAYGEELAGDIIIDLWEAYLREEGIEVATEVAVTFTHTTNIVNATAHGLTNTTPIRLYTDNTLPAGLSAGQWYYVVSTLTNSFQVALTVGGAAVAFTDSGTGNHSIRHSFSVDNGITLEEAIFNYVPVSQAFDAIADRTGMWWMIDENRRLHFVERITYTAPWGLTKTDIKYDSLRLEHSASKYRNRQVIRGPVDETSDQTEVRFGDGENQAFTFSYPLARVPTVSVKYDGSTGYVTKTVGIKGLDTGKDWYWSKGDAVIAQESTGVKLIAADSLKAIYKGEFPIVVVRQDMAGIADRLAVEGIGTGRVESVTDEPQQTTRTSALQLAAMLLKKYRVIGRTIKFRTRRHGLRPGHFQSVVLDDYGVDSDLLIESVNITDQDGVMLWYDVTGIEGPELGSWTRAFVDIVRMGSLKVREGVGESGVVVLLVDFEKNWLSTEGIGTGNPANIFQEFYPSTAPLYDATHGLSFDPDYRTTHLAWYETTSNEAGRKAITQQTGASTGSTQMNTVTYLQPYEAISTGITHFGWFGDTHASTTALSGVLVDFQVHPSGETKKDTAGAWQIEKTDNKWV